MAFTPTALRGNGNVFVPEGFEQKYVNPREVRTKEFMDLQEAKITGRPVNINLFKLEELDRRDTGADIMGIFAVGNYGDSRITVKIAAEDFIPRIPDEEHMPRYIQTGEPWTKQVYVTRYINNRLNKEIRVNIKDIVELENGDFLAIGSRIDAMRFDEKKFFFPDNREGIKVGDYVGAIITAVYRKKLDVEVCGVETTIEKDDVLHVEQENLRDIFKPGEGIYVKVMELDKNEDAKIVNSIRVSSKEAMEDPRELEIKKYRVKDKVKGTVVGYSHKKDANGNRTREIKGIVLSVNGSINVECPFTYNFERPKYGEECLFEVKKVDVQRKRLYGVIKTKTSMDR